MVYVLHCIMVVFRLLSLFCSYALSFLFITSTIPLYILSVFLVWPSFIASLSLSLVVGIYVVKIRTALSFQLTFLPRKGMYSTQRGVSCAAFFRVVRGKGSIPSLARF